MKVASMQASSAGVPLVPLAAARVTRPGSPRARVEEGVRAREGFWARPSPYDPAKAGQGNRTQTPARRPRAVVLDPHPAWTAAADAVGRAGGPGREPRPTRQRADGFLGSSQGLPPLDP